MAVVAAEKGTHAFCRNGPWGAWHKRCLSPFPMAGRVAGRQCGFRNARLDCLSRATGDAARGRQAGNQWDAQSGGGRDRRAHPRSHRLSGAVLARAACRRLGRAELVAAVSGPFGLRPDICPHGPVRDNVPIVAMVYLLGFFTWLAAAQAVENDRRGVAGQPPREAEDAQRVFVWPDLVYSELIAAVTLLGLLLAWSLLVPAPLEQPANAAITPNPSKAPWYFLGLQELLSYGDAWLAGVAAPAW